MNLLQFGILQPTTHVGRYVIKCSLPSLSIVMDVKFRSEESYGRTKHWSHSIVESEPVKEFLVK